MKSYVVKAVTSSNHTRAYPCPMLVGCCGVSMGIVVVGMDPWTPCHTSTNPTPITNSTSNIYIDSPNEINYIGIVSKYSVRII